MVESNPVEERNISAAAAPFPESINVPLMASLKMSSFLLDPEL